MTSKAIELVRQTLERLRRAHPDAHCELDHRSPFELLVATVLSAQSTDVAVNQVTPALFARWPGPQQLAEAPLPEVEAALGRLGMFRQKAKNIVGLARKLVEEHDGAVPRTLEELVALPGVGRKTANVVLGVAFGAPEGVVVDTHVQRLSQRLGWTRQTMPEPIERDLMRLFPREDWDPLSHTLIFHGRRVCTARRPACAACAVNDVCPCAFRAEQVGRKPPRRRAATKTTSTTATPAKKARSPRAASTTSSSTTSAKKTRPNAASATSATPAKKARSPKAASATSATPAKKARPNAASATSATPRKKARPSAASATSATPAKKARSPKAASAASATPAKKARASKAARATSATGSSSARSGTRARSSSAGPVTPKASKRA